MVLVTQIKTLKLLIGLVGEIAGADVKSLGVDRVLDEALRDREVAERGV